MLRTFAIALLATTMSVGLGRKRAYGQAESPVAMSNGAAGKGYMRLRSGKNSVPEGGVLSRLHERLHAIARKTSTGRKLPI